MSHTRPEAVGRRRREATLRELLDAGIVIGGARKVQLTREKAKKLYEAHRGPTNFHNLMRMG
ncbi:nucleoside diphosphate kinase domain protein [Necator americanus]|uniref:Nucleoside diphosphate kinase domain protein n=1 Tax=Necator americanus TaxID=51031 RepID=W2TUP4_NECAM|nr:nucleoside diphosphate kinase domain protein [Necator americanus]ETN85558.1 nucleoside diphosphate kinase domain protein [Necator americanus]